MGDGQEGFRKLLGVRNWRLMARHRDEWKALVEVAMVWPRSHRKKNKY